MTSSYIGIPEFFEDRCVFVTGATGFVGKVLVEKLLRSCPNIKMIYLLMRPKKGEAVQQRLNDLTSSQIFHHVRNDNPTFATKLTAMAGDLYESNLGLSEESVNELAENVSVILHSAASVRFDEPLKQAVRINLEAVQKVVVLAKKMKHLKAFVHVSTAYSNCDVDTIEEVVYPVRLQPHRLMDAVDWMDEDVLNEVTPRLLDQKPNTYTYTKHLAEHMVAEMGAGLPVAIVRPSIVGASWLEPFPGWVDNFNGATGLMAAMSRGLLRSMMGDEDGTADIVPVDVVANMILAVAWKVGLASTLANEREGESGSSSWRQVPVFNCTTGQINRFTWGMLERLSGESMVKYPSDCCVRVPRTKFTMSTGWHRSQWLLFHQLPAALLDIWRTVSGRPAMFVHLSKRIKRSVKTLAYFTTRQWQFANGNGFDLIERMSAADKKEFNFDVRRLNWSTYIENYCLGIKRFAMKEDMGGLEKARANIKRLQRLKLIGNLVLLVLAWRLLVSRMKVAQHLWTLMLGLAVRLIQKVPNVVRA